MNHQTVKQDVSEYYSQKLEKHGLTHQGVDWNSQETQWLRFQQLLRGFELKAPFSINDYGCGYGAFIDYLATQSLTYQYAGYDISDKMIQAAKDSYPEHAHVRFITGDQLEAADYTIASGIFNVRLNHTPEVWATYIRDCLSKMNQSSLKGFSFNILTAYSDPPYRRADLYYADPCFWFDYCKQHFSRNVALFHDYNLYEFTISVLKITD
jgi:SAM-dependent methyltransferase